MNKECGIVEDLLPLYVEDLTRSESKQLIEAHLKECSRCSELLTGLRKELPTNAKIKEVTYPEKPAMTLIKRIKGRIMVVVAGTFAAALLIGLFADVYIFSFLAYLSLGTAVLVFIWNVEQSAKWYWIGGMSMYVFSALAGFSIGLYTLSLAFILLALAVAHSFGWIKKRSHSFLGIGAGLFLWGIVLMIADGFWVFYPIIYLIEKVLG